MIAQLGYEEMTYRPTYIPVEFISDNRLPETSYRNVCAMSHRYAKCCIGQSPYSCDHFVNDSQAMLSYPGFYGACEKPLEKVNKAQIQKISVLPFVIRLSTASCCIYEKHVHSTLPAD